jgi:hypothetical protein
MKNSRLIARVACSFFAALAVPAVEARPVAPESELKGTLAYLRGRAGIRDFR